MSFEIKAGKSLGKNLRRLVRKQLDRALDELTAARGKAKDEAVHEARKAMKKVRAVLRLVRSEIGNGMYRKANASLRDTARPLTEVRDAKILIETIDKLQDQFQERVAGRTFSEVRNHLMAHARKVRKRVLGQEHAFSSVRKSLRALQPQIKQWTDVPSKWSSIDEGLQETYERASEAYVAAARDSTIEKLHEWRKQAKYLRYQVTLLRPIWPQRMEELVREADQMGELLGDDHDLTLLKQLLTAEREPFADAEAVELLQALIEHRQTELRKQALLLAERFFEEPAADFARRLKGYWRAWRKQERAEGANEDRAAVA
jgi:CHAD domain-containing protein